jgi:hypothetical protein
MANSVANRHLRVAAKPMTDKKKNTARTGRNSDASGSMRQRKSAHAANPSAITTPTIENRDDANSLVRVRAAKSDKPGPFMTLP